MRSTIHMLGITNVLTERLSKAVRYFVSFVPMCFTITGAMSSGPSIFILRGDGWCFYKLNYICDDGFINCDTFWECVSELFS